MLINCFLAAVVVMLTIKLWIMTGDVRKIQQQLGKSEEAYALYKEAYYYSLVLFFNELENKKPASNEMKEKLWKEGFHRITSYYSIQVKRLGNYSLPVDNMETYAQICARIGKL